MMLRTAVSDARIATRNLTLSLALSLVAFTSVGCQSTGNGANDGDPRIANLPVCLSKLVPSEWTCTQLVQRELSDGAAPTLAFAAAGSDDAQVSGFAGVNRFFGPLKQTDGALVFGPLAATRMGGPPERMELERAYLDMLAKVDAALLSGDTLQLVDDGAVLATFARAVK